MAASREYPGKSNKLRNEVSDVFTRWSLRRPCRAAAFDGARGARSDLVARLAEERWELLSEIFRSWQLRADHERSTQKKYAARPNNLVERAPRATPRPDPKSRSDHRKLAMFY